MAVTVKMDAQGKEPENMCTGCPGHCCRLLVDLTAYDITRLVVLAKKDSLDFVDLVFAKPDDAYAFRAQGAMVKLILKHKPDGYCIFYDEEGKLGCSVEEAKPAICLTYPFTEGLTRFQENALCPPRNRLRADFVKMNRQVYDDARWEFDRFMEIVDDWNLVSDGSESGTDFLRFASSEISLEMSFWGRPVRRVLRAFRSLQSRL